MSDDEGPIEADEGSFDDEMQEEEADSDIVMEDDQDKEAKGKRIPDAERCSVPFLTKYEKARVLGTRANQISQNADLLIDAKGETDPYKIAEMEFHVNKIPFIIRRYMPDGSYEDWKISELRT